MSTGKLAARRLAAGVATLGLLALGFSTITAPAYAAAIDGSLTNVSASINGPDEAFVGVEQQYDLAYNGCVPDSANAGDSWSIQLPSQLTNWPGGFTITNPADGSDTWINVSISGGTATFSLTPSGADSSNLCFQSWFGGTLHRDTGEGPQMLEVRNAGSTVIASKSITVVAMPHIPLDQEPGKRLWFTDDSDQCRENTGSCLAYQLRFPAGDHGLITVVDVAEDNWRFVCDPAPGTSVMREQETGYPIIDPSLTPNITIDSCTPERLEVTADTRGLPADQAYLLQGAMSAVEPGGEGGQTYRNLAVFTLGGQQESREQVVQSTYVGGVADGAHISISKTDAAGNDANTEAEAVELPDGTTGLRYTIRNRGTQALRNLAVTDTVTAGNATVSGLTCAFPGGATGTTWDGPLASGASFTCTASLSGVVGAHTNLAAVTAVGDGDEPVSDDDPYNAKNEETPTPPTPGIDISKRAEGDDSTNVDPGDHEIVVTHRNTGTEALHELTFADTTQSGNDVRWNADDLAALASAMLAPGESITVRGTVLVEAGTTHRDTVRVAATGVISGTIVTDEDPTTLVPPAPPTPPTPEIDISKRAEGDDSTNVDPGDHEIVVTHRNTGSEDLIDLTFADTTESGNDVRWNTDDLAALASAALAPDASISVRGTVLVEAGTTHRDTVRVTAKGAISGTTVTDEDPTTLVPPGLVSIGDRVWFDLDRDGIQEDGEPGYPGMAVVLLKDGAEVARTTTDSNGWYNFKDLLPSTDYVARFEKRADESFAAQAAGDDRAVDSNADRGTGLAPVTTPVDGDNEIGPNRADDPTIDAGIVRYNLVVAKELITEGPYYSGDEVEFVLVPANEGPATELGGWSVTDLLPEGLTAVEAEGEGYECAIGNDGADVTCVNDAPLAGGVIGEPIFVTAKIGKGVTGTLRNITYVAPSTKGDVPETNPLVVPERGVTDTTTTPTDNDAHADLSIDSLVSVGDYTWWDSNRNGVQNEGEKPVPGITVNLYDGDEQVASTITDENGFYSFVDLIPGRGYEIEFIKPDGSTFTLHKQSEDGAVDSDADPETGRYTFAAPTAGTNSSTDPDDPTIDAGFWSQINLVLGKSLASQGTHTVGGTAIFTLDPSNEGPMDALPGWSVTEVLPKELELVKMSGKGYTCEGVTCVSDSPLAAGQHGEPITVEARILESATKIDRVHNIAFVAPVEGDIPETNPLAVPKRGTDTDKTDTDNDAQAFVKVPAPVIPSIPSGIPGGSVGIAVGLGALAAAGGALLLVKRRKSGNAVESDDDQDTADAA